MPWCRSGSIIDSSVVSWPPCRLPVEVKTQAGLPVSAPLEPERAGAVEEMLQRRGHVAEARRAAEREARAFLEVAVFAKGRPFFRDRGNVAVDTRRNPRNRAQARLRARHALHAFGNQLGHAPHRAAGAVVEDEDLDHACIIAPRHEGKPGRHSPSRAPDCRARCAHRRRSAALVETLGDSVSFYKIGLELSTSGEYYTLLDWLVKRGNRVFCDLKLHDIPETVRRAVANLRGRGVTFLTVHADRGVMEAAVKEKGDIGILAVTVLTSTSQADLAEQGYTGKLEDLVLARARAAAESGCDGVIYLRARSCRHQGEVRREAARRHARHPARGRRRGRPEARGGRRAGLQERRRLHRRRPADPRREGSGRRRRGDPGDDRRGIPGLRRPGRPLSRRCCSLRTVAGLAQAPAPARSSANQGATSMDQLDMGTRLPAHRPVSAAGKAGGPDSFRSRLAGSARSCAASTSTRTSSTTRAARPGRWAARSRYQSGYLADLLRIGAVAYTSQRLYGPKDRDGTLLLKPGQESYTVLGQVYGEVKFCDELYGAIGRKEYNTPYLNGNDSRMSPNTFQGASLYGKAGGTRDGARVALRRRLHRQDQAAQWRRFRLDVDRGRRRA